MSTSPAGVFAPHLGAEPHSVVVAVDDSPVGLAATALAVEEAVERHLPLRIAYAIRPGHPHSSIPRIPALVGDLVDAAHRAHPELDISQRIAPMSAVQLLLEESEGAALLVVGTESSDEDRGSVAISTARLLEGAVRCPLLVAPTRAASGTR
jgi:nucleotide-binding universal stress UspA family protein